ncbi:MAG: glycosyltransferase family 2 protein [Candidatus Bathyarchaeota archaeon]|nr:glycosyltransferase family 2 protein [Candidatus Bathyarchaeota archaeon]
MKYVALTSGRNEERFIRQTVEAVLALEPAALVYVVVDDDSTDHTAEILREYEKVTLLRLKNPRHETRGVNLAWALNSGVKKVTKLVPDWDFLLKIDADSVLPKDYFKKLIKKFEENPHLGVSSGTPTDEKVWRGRASDGAKIYRRACWDDIGHFTPGNAFDTLALIQAKQHGWIVESFPEIKYTQLRTWRRGNLGRWVLSGRSRYFLGFPVWHTFLIALVYATDRPCILGGFTMFLSHALTALGRLHKPHSREYYEFAKKYAMWELLERLKEKRLT